jgi:ubiquitin C-terminal hydrolase
LTTHTTSFAAISCGERAKIFCFRCGDFVTHPVFEQERLRIALSQGLPWMSWKDHPVLRSFDPFQFIKTQDHGIVWRGLVATYPPLVSRDHLKAAQLSLRRQQLFAGVLHEPWLNENLEVQRFCASQLLLQENVRQKIAAPIGMYNLGNTCFQTAILQCLVHSVPLQRYFLRDVGHHHLSCKVYRDALLKKKKKEKETTASSTTSDLPSATTTPPSTAVAAPTMTEPVIKPLLDPFDKESICLGCEMDRLFLMYYGSTVGIDANHLLTTASGSLLENSSDEKGQDVLKGDPLLLSDMLTATWRTGEMDHLAGYEQRDAHEFLNSFLELTGKHTKIYRDRVKAALNVARLDNSIVPHNEKVEDGEKLPYQIMPFLFYMHLMVSYCCCSSDHEDIIKHLFEGSLRSVLACEECGGKRTMNEPFMNISLTLSEEVDRLRKETLPTGNTMRISLETCLEHFILPEKLGDPVDCPSCRKKTSTKKQHTFSKLPKILCLHLKRFDAARNKKIDEPVSFPARGLNMGPLLSHW